MPSRLNNGGIVGPFQQETESGIWSVDSNVVTGPRYSASINGSTFNEGDDVVITISATNLFENSTVRFTINGIGSTDVQGVSGGSITGTSPYSGLINVTASGGTGSGQLTLTLSEDLEAEGTELYSIVFDATDSLEYPTGLDYTQFNITVIDTSVTKTIGFNLDEAIYDIANTSFVYADENGYTIDEGKQYKIQFFGRNLTGSINWSLSPASNTDIDIVSGTSTYISSETVGFDVYYKHEVPFSTIADFLLEGSEEYTFIIRYQPDITIESSLAFTLSDTSRPEIYLTNSPATTLIEGDTLSLYLNSIHSQLSFVIRDENGNTTNEFLESNNAILGLPEGSVIQGQQVFDTAGSFDFVVPPYVYSISAVAVGGGGGGSTTTTSTNGISGGGGGGGALHWRTFAVTPGETLTVVVGAAGTGGTAAAQDNATSGGESAIKRGETYLVRAGGGEKGTYGLISPNGSPAAGGVSYYNALGGGGGDGGSGGRGSNGNTGGGAGGAGGYSGNGGRGSEHNIRAATVGTGGGGAGANGVNNLTTPVTWGGGGVGILGESDSGTNLIASFGSGSTAFTTSSLGQAQAGSYGVGVIERTRVYGGGGNGAEDDSPQAAADGGGGAVRLIWGGARSYPSANTADASGTIYPTITPQTRYQYSIDVTPKYDSVTEPNATYSILVQDGSVAPENINANTAIFSHDFTLTNLLTYQLDEPSSNTVTVDENTVQIIKIKTLASIEDPKWRLVEENTSLVRGNAVSPIIVLDQQSFDSVTSVTANSAVDIFADGTQLKESVLKIYSTEQGGQTTAKIEIYFPTTNAVLDTITFNILEASPVVDHNYYNVLWDHQPSNVSRLASTSLIAYTNAESILDNYYPLINTQGDLDLVNITTGAFSTAGYRDIYRYTIPRDGIYELVCRGGRGGSEPVTSSTTFGAAAITVGRKVFKRGDVIYGVAGVGGGCIRTTSNTSITYSISGGGGMSAWFYYPNNNIPNNDVQPIPLMVAGGGGGWTQDYNNAVITNLSSQASLTTSGKNYTYAGGVNGLPGAGFSSTSTNSGGGRGGAGWNAFTYSTADSLYGKGPWNNGVALTTVNSPFVGGTRVDYSNFLSSQHTNGYIAAGGWGGGGGATAALNVINGASTPTSRGAGGGGGYSGGGGGMATGTSAILGGGGGSYVSNELSQTSIFLDVDNVANPTGSGTSARFNGYIWINQIDAAVNLPDAYFLVSPVTNISEGENLTLSINSSSSELSFVVREAGQANFTAGSSQISNSGNTVTGIASGDRYVYQITIGAVLDLVEETPNPTYNLYIVSGNTAAESIDQTNPILSHSFTTTDPVLFSLVTPSSNSATIEEQSVQTIKVRTLALEGVELPKWRFTTTNASVRKSNGTAPTLLEELSFTSVLTTSDPATDDFPAGTSVYENTAEFFTTEAGGDTTISIEIYQPVANSILQTIDYTITQATPVSDHSYYNVIWYHQPASPAGIVSRTAADSGVAFTFSGEDLASNYSNLNTEGAFDLVDVSTNSFVTPGPGGFTNIYRFIIPQDGVWELIAQGAWGGGPYESTGLTATHFGCPVYASGRKLFKRGDVIYGVAGAQGGAVSYGGYIRIAGGGGMSAWFQYPNNVADPTVNPTPLIVAGGGGGWVSGSTGITGNGEPNYGEQTSIASRANTATSGRAGLRGPNMTGAVGAGGTNGAGGLNSNNYKTNSTADGAGRGGAGWINNQDNSLITSTTEKDLLVGQGPTIGTFTNGLLTPFLGGVRATAPSDNLGTAHNSGYIAAGGWGGGGGATSFRTVEHQRPWFCGAGGGGGYSGGGGAVIYNEADYCQAGGGGSFISPTMSQVSLANQTGNFFWVTVQGTEDRDGFLYIRRVE